MTWSFHHYFNNCNGGLISKLRLADAQTNSLIELRNLIRSRTREVFEEAKKLVKTSYSTMSLESITEQFADTHLKYLDESAQTEAAQLIQAMDKETRTAFRSLNPRFWTQGSFQYDTLNYPYFTPPQEMDIDDGTYLPMHFFEDKPAIGHRLLLLLVDSSLKSLAHENPGWKFEPKDTCARLKIPKENTHIDVPMYAIPLDQFQSKEAAITEAISFEAVNAVYNRTDYELDADSVNLAIREGEHKWIKSDPKIVEDWFNDSCRRIGPHVRKVCRFIKRWRDAQWEDGGGPSSISLMAATVNILDRVPHHGNDLGATMKVVSHHLPGEFEAGIESPDHTDEKPLFPPLLEHDVREQQIMEKLHELKTTIDRAGASPTKELALDTINQAFGNHVTKIDLIISSKAAPAFDKEPSTGKQAARISSTMASG